MSNVNADATQLLTILKNMRTSISSIETTRSSVKMKYQQLGIGWNDKKYDELGTIVKDCNKALNDILQIMLQAEKYVASLAKSVQEYDNVNLDTPSARNSFLQGLQTPNVGNSSYQYCLGVLTQGSTPDGYIAVISQRKQFAFPLEDCYISSGFFVRPQPVPQQILEYWIDCSDSCTKHGRSCEQARGNKLFLHLLDLSYQKLHCSRLLVNALYNFPVSNVLSDPVDIQNLVSSVYQRNGQTLL